MRSYRSRISAGDVGDHPLPAGVATVAPVREERLGLAGGAAVEAVDAFDPRGAQRALGARPEVEAAVAEDVVAEALAEGPRHLLPHLVAARADPRADRGRQPPAGERLGTRGDDAGEEPFPPGVEDGDGRLPRAG